MISGTERGLGSDDLPLALSKEAKADETFDGRRIAFSV
jgi:hypothetical protein